MSNTSLRRADRVSQILEQLAAQGSVKVTNLAADFAVSTATLRRDLQMLEDQKLLLRRYGGAVAHQVAYELPVRYRGGQHREQKQAIAVFAAALLPRGPFTMGLTGGTTTTAVARLLADRVDISVVTNALNIAADLAMRPRLKVIMTGGFTRPQSYEAVGPLAELTLARLSFEVAVVGVDGISAAGGLTTHDEVEAHTNHAMIRQAARVIVVADGTKIGHTLLACMGSLHDVHELVTDRSADRDELDKLRAAGITVHIADT